MDAATQTLKRIFEVDRRYLVPMFQRPYVWRAEAQWIPLWEDVRGVADRVAAGGETVRPHFLGAVVLDHVRGSSAQVEARLVVDGQQRLTTLQLLLEAASDICQQRGWDHYRRAFVKLTRNDDPLSRDPDDVFKVWPTNADRDVFRKVMEAQSAKALREDLAPPAKGLDSAIAQGYLFFSAAVQDWLTDGADEAAKRAGYLHTALREWIRLVVIDLGETDDAQLIFETLNARGTPLLPADLIKNYFFHLAQKKAPHVESLHRAHWKHFDDEAKYWRTEVTAGRVKRSRLDLFLQHYLAMETCEEVQVGHLYADFKRHIDGSPRPVQEQLASVAAYSHVFRGFDESDRRSRAALFFSRLEDLQVTTAHPLLLHLFGLNLTTPELETALLDIESFLVRRLVCHLTTKNYNRLFLDALKATRGEKADVARALRDHLAQGRGDSVRWPGDREFRQAWLGAPIYRTQARRRTRMLLEALELAKRGPKTESAALAKDLTIEHLLPQSWEAEWPLDQAADRDEARGERGRLLHTLGNLTLLTKALNPSISNGPWATKRAGIKDNSVLMLNKGLGDLEAWNEAAMRARATELYDLAAKLWPRPPQPDEPMPGLAAPAWELLEGESESAATATATPGVECPIPGCSYVFKKSLGGWDAHVSSRKKHLSWHPEVAEPAARRALFRAEYPSFLGDTSAGEALAGRDYWERRADARSLSVVDECEKGLAATGVTLRWSYTRHYIALSGPGRALAWFGPKRSGSHCHIRIRTEKQLRKQQASQLNEAGIRMVVNEKGPPSIDITAGELAKHWPLVLGLFESAFRRAEQ